MKKRYAKVRERELGKSSTGGTAPAADDQNNTSDNDELDAHEHDSERHTQDTRRSLLAKEAAVEQPPDNSPDVQPRTLRVGREAVQQPPEAENGDTDDGPIHPDRKRIQRAKTKPFNKELQEAKKRRAEREAARRAREEAIEERDRKREERERWRKQMAKARQPGKNGQRKLGRESKVLFEKVQRLVGS